MSGNNRPEWVVKDLSNLLGLDAESVTQMLLPEFEGYTQQVKLKSHLQDFLGPSQFAKAFTERYISLRFPSISSTSNALPTPSSPDGPMKSAGPGRRSKHASGSNTPFNSNSNSHILPTSEAISAAFGPGGKIYQKNREVDDDNWMSRGGSAQGSGSITPSLSQTPQHHQSGRATPARSAGAFSIHEAKSRGKHRPNPVGTDISHGNKIWDLPKSKNVLLLEGMLKDLKDLQAGEGKVKSNNQPECFCQVYTPHCPNCGLIICSLHPPHLPCPSCRSPIHSPAALARLILRINEDIDAQLALEQSERDEEERKKMEQVKAQAAFPYLAGAGSKTSAPEQYQEEGMKVLTIGGGGGKGKGKGRAVLTTTYTRPVSSSTSTSKAEEEAPVEVVSRPKSHLVDSNKVEKEITKLNTWRKEEDRPWSDPRASKTGSGLEYIPPLVISISTDNNHIGRRRAKKGKGLGADGRAVVGAAAS